MKKISLARSETGFRILDEWHTRYQDKLSFDFETQQVQTSFGFCEILTSGLDAPENEPPLLLLHGATAGAPFALGELLDLPARLKFHGVNIPGQSTRAAPVRLSFQTQDYSRWLGEVLDGLGLERAFICGVSWGASVALQLAKHSPERVEALLLVVPASLVKGSTLQAFWKVGLPMLRYKMFPTEENRDKALAGFLTTSDPMWSSYLGEVLAHWNLDFSTPPLMKTEDLKALKAPVYVIAADQDLYFPGERVIERSAELFPNYVGGHILRNTRHTPSFETSARLAFSELLEKAVHRLRRHLTTNPTTSEEAVPKLRS